MYFDPQHLTISRNPDIFLRLHQRIFGAIMWSVCKLWS
jgi:hypothetical protein